MRLASAMRRSEVHDIAFLVGWFVSPGLREQQSSVLEMNTFCGVIIERDVRIDDCFDLSV